MDPVNPTNATRHLEREGVSSATRTFTVDEDHLDAISVANELGVGPEGVFKTLVTIDRRSLVESSAP